MILYQEGDTRGMEAEANHILTTLTQAYPGHPWAVRVYDGGFFIRHLDFPANWGMNCRHRTRLYSASAQKREIIRMAGEWLERASLKRGRSEDIPIRRVEGVPEKFQPPEYREQPKQQGPDIVIAADQYQSLREIVRPQVEDLVDDS